jgi:type VI secretion system protein ImpK
MTAPASGARLLTTFRLFCGEVLRLEAQVVVLPGAPVPAASAAAYDRVRLKLMPFFQPSVSAASGTSAPPDAQTQQAQYLMAVFADDVFLNIEWAGQEAWQSNPLEEELFGTTEGGTEVFRRIQQILTYPDPTDLPLAKMYLTALGLGFEGSYRGQTDGDAELAQIRAQLWTLIAAGDPDLAAGHLFPEAYRHTLDSMTPSRLPRPWGWVAAFVAVFLLWLVASVPIWREQTSTLRGVLDAIELSGAGGAAGP